MSRELVEEAKKARKHLEKVNWDYSGACGDDYERLRTELQEAHVKAKDARVKLRAAVFSEFGINVDELKQLCWD